MLLLAAVTLLVIVRFARLLSVVFVFFLSFYLSFFFRGLLVLAPGYGTDCTSLFNSA